MPRILIAYSAADFKLLTVAALLVTMARSKVEVFVRAHSISNRGTEMFFRKLMVNEVLALLTIFRLLGRSFGAAAVLTTIRGEVDDFRPPVPSACTSNEYDVAGGSPANVVADTSPTTREILPELPTLPAVTL